MGFRSNFISEDIRGIEVPRWFIEKYPDHTIWHNHERGTYHFPIAQLWESKFYKKFTDTEIFQDIQKVIKETAIDDIIIILLHECGGITRVKITADSITGREPTAWKEVDHVEHDYCYGCSDTEDIHTLPPSQK